MLNRWCNQCLDISRLGTLLLLLILAACTQKVPAPLENAWREDLPNKGIHVVQRGETVYAISVLYGIDVNKLIAYNGLKKPYSVYPQQTLYINRYAPSKRATAASPMRSTPPPKSMPQRVTPSKAKTPIVRGKSRQVAGIYWQWPTLGHLIQGYAPKKGAKGIDISGTLAQPVYAAASGSVVYSGDGLPGYGRLIIIKHSANYLSAYAYNQKLLVKEGQTVKAGQQIATLGESLEARRPALHFEIRYKGKPVNPTAYLPNR